MGTTPSRKTFQQPEEVCESSFQDIRRLTCCWSIIALQEA